MKKAVLYARFSPRRNAEQCESIETQLELCRAYCAKHDLDVIGEFEDRALSGKDEDRPGLWAALEALKPGYVLVVYRLDRLARSVYLSHLIEQHVAKRRASIVSTNGEGTWEDTDDQWLVRRILQTLAEYERRMIAARTRAAMLRHQANGRRMSDRCPYGWTNSPTDTTRLVEVPEEQDAIRRIVELRRAGRRLSDICEALDATGISYRAGLGWNHRTVRRILTRAGVT